MGLLNDLDEAAKRMREQRELDKKMEEQAKQKTEEAQKRALEKERERKEEGFI